MEVLHSLQKLKQTPVWVTIGAYDGIHRGHQALISEMTIKAHENSHASVVVSLFPHPAIVKGRITPPFYLTSQDDRIEVLQALGVDVLLFYPFTETISNFSPAEYIHSLLDIMDIHQIWVGDDFALGRDRQGSLDVLAELGRELGYTLLAYPQYRLEGQIVSASNIRNHLLNAELDQVTHLLGRPYSVHGVCNQSDIPSLINFVHWDQQLLPPAGSYMGTFKSSPSIPSQNLTFHIHENDGVKRILLDTNSTRLCDFDTISSIEFISQKH